MIENSALYIVHMLEETLIKIVILFKIVVLGEFDPEQTGSVGVGVVCF